MKTPSSNSPPNIVKESLLQILNSPNLYLDEVREEEPFYTKDGTIRTLFISLRKCGDKKDKEVRISQFSETLSNHDIFDVRIITDVNYINTIRNIKMYSNFNEESYFIAFSFFDNQSSEDPY